MQREIRYFKGELRTGEGDDFVLLGYAALFNHESRDLGGFREVIAPGAFTRSLKNGDDVVCLFNHDNDKILGRVAATTLELKQDEKGLQYRCQLDPTNTSHRDLYASVKRRDISESSFGFMVPKGGQQWSTRQDATGADYAFRTITDVDLYDVSPVTFPAYTGTQVVARSLFPDGEIKEIRSAIDGLKTGLPEKRDDETDESYEDLISEISSALADKYPALYEDGTPIPDGYYNTGKYWVCETHANYLIVCDWASGDYYRISYQEAENDTFTFGEPQPVEKEWVPSDDARAKKAVTEIREWVAKNKPAAAPQVRAHSKEHVEGDCADPECACQNRMVGLDDFYDPEDDADKEEDDDNERKLRKAARIAELRKKSEQVLTKSVDGKNLTADSFAFVGDATKTETWKLPIFDVDHTRDALARFDQTQGIPAADRANVLRKIKAAAEKFGIKVSDDDNVRCLRTCALDADEIRGIHARLSLIEF